MPQYRHVTDLRTFAAELSYDIDIRLERAPARSRPFPIGLIVDMLAPAGELAPLRPPADELPEIGHERTPDGKPVIEWAVLQKAAQRAVDRNLPLHELDDHPGLYVCIGIEGDLALLAFDDAFEAACLRGDALRLGKLLYIRVAGGPLLN